MVRLQIYSMGHFSGIWEFVYLNTQLYHSLAYDHKILHPNRDTYSAIFIVPLIIHSEIQKRLDICPQMNWIKKSQHIYTNYSDIKKLKLSGKWIYPEKQTTQTGITNMLCIHPLISGCLLLVIGKQSRINIITKLRNILRDEVTLPSNGK